VLTRDNHLSIANQKPLDDAFREIAHPVDFKFGAAMIADIEHNHPPMPTR